jgi:predicted nuclease with TOPRIM domain
MGELKENLRRHEDMHQARVTELERHLREVETEKNRLQEELVSERSKGLWARMRDIFK